jgi:hypothetical protein
VFHVSNIGVELSIIVMSGSSDAFEDRLDPIKLAFPDMVPRRLRSKVCDEEQWDRKNPLGGVWSSPRPVGFDFGYSS